MSNGISQLWKNEDWWAVWVGFGLIIAALLRWLPVTPKVGRWSSAPLDAFLTVTDGGTSAITLLHLAGLLIGLVIITSIAIAFMKTVPLGRYLPAFAVVFVLAILAYWIANQAETRHWGLSYALWALLIGLIISNTIGTPKWLKAGAQTELFIKIGLVLLGAEILFKKILSLGAPGLMVAWIVTPVVIFFMWRFGVKSLKCRTKSW